MANKVYFALALLLLVTESLQTPTSRVKRGEGDDKDDGGGQATAAVIQPATGGDKPAPQGTGSQGSGPAIPFFPGGGSDPNNMDWRKVTDQFVQFIQSQNSNFLSGK